MFALIFGPGLLFSSSFPRLLLSDLSCHDWHSIISEGSY